MIRKIVFWLIIALCLPVAVQAEKRFTLVIDAGHGGKDAGALGKYSKEKTINLNVALAFGRYVEKNCSDVRVIYTRKTDVFIPLHERAAIANRNKADVFISIHTNSVASRRPVAGLETYTMGMRRSDEKLSAAMRENNVVLIEKDYQQHYAGFDPRSPESYIIFEVLNDAHMLESVELAKAIQRNVCRTANRPNKGVRQDAFLVLRETSMPACLIELGYITTASEEAYLTNPTNVEAMGRGIYQAFVEYKNKMTGKTATAPAPQPAPVEEAPAPESPAPPVEQQQAPQSSEAPQAPATPETSTTPETPTTQEQSATPALPAAEEGPVFKVQFMTSERRLKSTDSRFKGLKDVSAYQDGGLWKYTVGNTTNYQKVRQLRAEVGKSFPQAFIVAFKNGVRMDTQTAIREASSRR